MHEGQVDVRAPALQAAIARQFPRLAGEGVVPVPSAGTVIAPFRVGDSLLARVPLVPDESPAFVDRVRAEGRHARHLAENVDVSVPQLVAIGAPFEGYAGAWSLWTWLAGRSLDRVLDASPADVDLGLLAADLGALLSSIRAVPVEHATWNGNGRGGVPLADSDWVRTSIERSRHLIDPSAATRVWEESLTAPPHAGAPVAIHGDPMPGNLLVTERRLSGLIDVSLPVVGDPAADLQPAWVIFDEPERTAFRSAMGLDDSAWQRGRGWAFEMAIGGLHYYEHTNPVFFRTARRTLDRLLACADPPPAGL
ncbi:phosphotransferase [Mobilicoccus massiliensis]|uniref:phosphotransferase n=1 Tax=Mobilicoccus massiliensis TaxID=1522310 RepID=UPI00058C3A7E|nr:phosphotransferase [Mobilicoccus massiliensis]